MLCIPVFICGKLICLLSWPWLKLNLNSIYSSTRFIFILNCKTRDNRKRKCINKTCNKLCSGTMLRGNPVRLDAKRQPFGFSFIFSLNSGKIRDFSGPKFSNLWYLSYCSIIWASSSIASFRFDLRARAFQLSGFDAMQTVSPE